MRERAAFASGLIWLLQWGLLSSLAVPLGWVGGDIVAWLTLLLYTPLALVPSGVITGGLLGFGGQALLRHRLGEARRWAGATLVGWVGAAIVFAVIYEITDSFFFPEYGAFALLAGSMAALAQGWGMRSRGTKALWWFVISVCGWGIGAAAQPLVPMDPYGIVVGLSYGVITGLAMSGIFAQKADA